MQDDLGNVNEAYPWDDDAPSWANRYLWPVLVETLEHECPPPTRIFEVGCGNGATASMLLARGYDVTGVDPSESGVRVAHSAASGARLEKGSAYDDLSARYGRFPVVISLEVVEHCFWPRRFASTIFDLLEPGGIVILSTPYHGYLKNLALAVANRFDAHWSPLWDGGHIKFWSEATLGQLLQETGFVSIRFRRVGRIPPLAKSMIAIARRPK